MLRILHCLNSRLTDGGKVVSPTHRPRSTPQKHYFSASGTHLSEAEQNWRDTSHQLKLKLIYDRQSVGQPVLVSGTHLGSVINFFFSLKFSLDSCGFVIL
jgi:hypothetical protein